MIRRAFSKSIYFIFIFIFTFMLFYGGSRIEFSAPQATLVPQGGLYLATIPGSSDPTQDEWPMFRGQLNHTGVAYTTFTARASLFWNYTTGNIILWSSPAVAGGRLYLGSYDGKVYCLNATTGEFLWSYPTGAVVDSSPAVSDGRVYIGNYGGKVYCLNATTGGLLWSYLTGGYVGYSSPAVAGGRVYVGNSDHKVYCLNATTGKSLWNYTTGGEVWSSPAVAGGRVYMGDSNNKVYCLNATTGKQLWNHTTWGGFPSPAVAGGRVYVGDMNREVYCLNATTGGLLWDYTTGDSVFSSAAVADGRVYVGSCDQKVYCLNATTGGVLWSYITGGVVESSPAVAGGLVYVGNSDHKVYCLNATTGKSLWNYTTGAAVESSPAVAGGRVYVGSQDHKIYCLPTYLDTFPPTYTSVNESADPLELGGTEAITIYGLADLSGIQTVQIEFGESNHTMTNLNSGIWRYNIWKPSNVSTYSYNIYIQDISGNWNKTSGAIQVINTTLPTYISVTESADPLELGYPETIIIVGVSDLSGIQTVMLEIEGSNHTMINLGAGTWYSNTWTPSNAGTYSYTIYMQDNLGNWNATSGSIQVNETASPPVLDFLTWLLLFMFVGTAIFTVLLYRRLNKKIRQLSSPKPIPPKDLPKK